MARHQRTKSATLLTVEDNDLVRHESLAYTDGYADARDFGPTGHFMPTHYGPAARESYSQGFKRGLRVYRVTESMRLVS